jgi:hypothetical protein
VATAAVIDGGMDSLDQVSNRGYDIGARERRHMNISAPLLRIPISSSQEQLPVETYDNVNQDAVPLLLRIFPCCLTYLADASKSERGRPGGARDGMGLVAQDAFAI